MISKNKHFTREWTINQVSKSMSDLLKRDPFLEVITIWIKFKESELNGFINHIECLSTFPNEFALKSIINKALDNVSIQYRKDKRLTHLKIMLKTALNTDKLGETELIDITKTNI